MQITLIMKALGQAHFKCTHFFLAANVSFLFCHVSEYISGNSSEKLTKLAFRQPPHNGFVLLHSPLLVWFKYLARVHAESGQKRHLTIKFTLM